MEEREGGGWCEVGRSVRSSCEPRRQLAEDTLAAGVMWNVHWNLSHCRVSHTSVTQPSLWVCLFLSGVLSWRCCLLWAMQMADAGHPLFSVSCLCVCCHRAWGREWTRLWLSSPWRRHSPWSIREQNALTEDFVEKFHLTESSTTTKPHQQNKT